MTNPAESFAALRGLTLPDVANTRSGVEYSPSTMIWSFRDGIFEINISFNRVPKACEPLIHGFKLTLIWCLANLSPITSINYFSSTISFLKHLAIDRCDIREITPEDILVYKISSTVASSTLSSLKAFLMRWVSIGAPGITKDTATFLAYLSIKQHPTGVAVATLDPINGPFDDLEYEAIQAALNNAYAKNEIETDDFLLSFLLMALGVRPIQLACLKCSDLITPKEGKDEDYVLMVPRAKQKNQISRDEFKFRPLPYQLGEALHRHIQTVQVKFAGILTNLNDCPIFYEINEDKNTTNNRFNYHLNPIKLSKKIIATFKKLSVPSERLNGEPIHATAVRFRRTFATRAAEEGFPLLVIAELLDHSDTRRVKVYSGLTTRVRSNFSRKIAMQMAPLAQVFSGKIISKEADATRPNSTSRLMDLRVDQQGVGIGNCGSHAHCGFAKPIACFACNSFEPWLDAPHEAMLDYLLEHRKYLIKTTDFRIASINDRSILGCAQVILRCREIKKGGKRNG